MSYFCLISGIAKKRIDNRYANTALPGRKHTKYLASAPAHASPVPGPSFQALDGSCPDDSSRILDAGPCLSLHRPILSPPFVSSASVISPKKKKLSLLKRMFHILALLQNHMPREEKMEG